MNSMSDHDNPLSSPFGRVFSRPEFDQVINTALGLRHPVNLDALKAELSSSLAVHHPRFTSLLLHDPRRPNKTLWRKTTLNVDDHVTVVDVPGAAGDPEAAANAYLADLAESPPMSRDKPLWEVHVLAGLNCVVLRVHHALGDGISLMSLLETCFGCEEKAAVGGGNRRRGSRWGTVKTVWYTAAYAALSTWRILGSRDKKTVVRGGEGVEHWPRTVVTANFKVNDMKRVKNAIPNGTMNDVLMGVLASGLAKYLNVHSPKAMLRGIQLTSLVVANLRKHSSLQDISNLMKSGSGSRSSWGNKFGLFAVPIKCRKEPLHPLQHVTRMKSIMDQKKQSFEAHLLQSTLGFALSVLGPKMGSWLYKRALDATTLLISNIAGPRQEIAIAGNPVTFIKLCISSLSQAMTLHLITYKGRAELQISVARDIIADAEFLAKCFEDALVEMNDVVQPMSNGPMA